MKIKSISSSLVKVWQNGTQMEGKITLRSTDGSGNLVTFKVYTEAVTTIDNKGNKTITPTNIWQSKDYTKQANEVKN